MVSYVVFFHLKLLKTVYEPQSKPTKLKKKKRKKKEMHQGGKKVSVKNFHRHQKPVSMEKKKTGTHKVSNRKITQLGKSFHSWSYDLSASTEYKNSLATITSEQLINTG